MRRLIGIFVTAAALAACGSSGSTSGPTGSTAPIEIGSPTPAPSPPAWTVSLAQAPYHPKIDPTQFTDTITNPYFPLSPGTVMVYEGTRDGVPLRIEVTVTGETKTIIGVKCIVVRDIVSGALDERTSDWYAQDSSGNVWYFGEDTKEYTNGVVTSTAGTWEAGVDGAIPGIIMLATPAKGDAYREEYRPSVAEDVALVTQLNATAKTPSHTYSNVLVTNTRDLLDTTKDEDKYFAPGVGFVRSTGLVNGHREEIWLTSILTGK